MNRDIKCVHGFNVCIPCEELREIRHQQVLSAHTELAPSEYPDRSHRRTSFQFADGGTTPVLHIYGCTTQRQRNVIELLFKCNAIIHRFADYYAWDDHRKQLCAARMLSNGKMQHSFYNGYLEFDSEGYMFEHIAPALLNQWSEWR